MEIGNLAQWAGFGGTLLALILSIRNATSKRGDDAINALRSDIGRAFSQIDGYSQRMTRLEGEVQHLPSKDTTHRLETGMARLEGELKVTAEALKSISSISHRLQEFLLTQAEKK